MFRTDMKCNTSLYTILITNTNLITKLTTLKIKEGNY